MKTSRVVLVDLREASADLPAELAGGVVVVDDASSLVEHAEMYMSLADEDMVTAVVCVAVGESSTNNTLDGVVLTLPPALRYATVLWVGDPRGVDWAPERSSPRPVDQRGDSLDRLVAALQVPTVFDQVVTAAESLSCAVANPGIRLVSSAADPAELAEARTEAVRSLCATDQPASHVLDASIRGAYMPHSREGTVLAGPVEDARTEALRRLDHVAELARTLGTSRALFGARRLTGQLGSEVAWAGQAAETYRRGVVELLNRMDGHLQVGRPSVETVMDLGVQDPREADSGEITADLRVAVDACLDGGTALPSLARELRLVAGNSGPQGCTAALDEVRGQGPLSLGMPAFAKWPLRLATLPLIFLSCAALALLLGPGWPGWAGGGLLAAAWFGSGWLLLGRRPEQKGELGLGAAMMPAMLTYGPTAVLGTTAGVTAGRLLAEQIDVPPLTAQVLTVLIVLLSMATVALSWRSAVHRLRDPLQVAQLRDTVEALARLAEEVTVREWLPMRHRKAIAAAAAEVANGLEEITGTLEEAGNRLFVVPRPESSEDGPVRMLRPLPQELYAVVRSDLVDVCRAALDPAWPAAKAAVRTAKGVYAQRLDRLLGAYGANVSRHGLMAATQISRDDAPRAALMASVWSESPAALAALRTEVDGDMTQLCRSGQLRYLSTAAEPGLVRFAPLQLRRVLERDGVHKELVTDFRIAWSEGGDLVGALRLLPLRPESVRQVVGGVQ